VAGGSGSVIQAIIRATAGVSGTNVLSAPHILTSDNEEAEIKIGNNIPIITSRVQSAAGIQNTSGNLSTSVNVERQDIGVTLRVTPQISEGDSVRLEIFQEVTDVNQGLTSTTGNAADVGVALSNRKVQNTVTVADGETVVIGGLISDNYQDKVTKIPFLGDIPVLGWLFKSTKHDLTKTNLLVFLTPHIVRAPEDLERQTIRKREEFRQHSAEAVEQSEEEKRAEASRKAEAAAAGLPYQRSEGRNPVRGALMRHEKRYPLQRMRAIEEAQAKQRKAARAAQAAAAKAPAYGVLAAAFEEEGPAKLLLRSILDAGYTASLVTEAGAGAPRLELRVGPYPNLPAARAAAAALASAFDLAPRVLVEPAGP